MGTSAKPGIYDWSTTANDNSTAGDVNLAEGQLPNTLNNSLRQALSDSRAAFEDFPWVDLGYVPTYASATSFTIPTDVTSLFHAGRRLRLYGTVLGDLYCTIESSSYSAPDSTIVVRVDDGTALTSNLSRVYQSIIDANNSPLPVTYVQQDNKIINGTFDIWQRGNSQSTGGYGSADRWECNNTGATRSVSRSAFTAGQTDVPGNPKYYMTTDITVAGSSAGDRVINQQKIEDVYNYAGQEITLSFYAKAASGTPTIAVEFLQNFGATEKSGDHADWSGDGVQTVTLSTSWQRFSLTVTVPSISGETIGSNSFLNVAFWFDAGTTYAARAGSIGHQTGTFDISEVEIVEGSQPLPCKRPTYEETLRACQRYYEISDARGLCYSGDVTNGGNYRTSYIYKVAKRDTPLISFTNELVAGFPSGNPSASVTGINSLNVDKGANSNTNGAYYMYSIAIESEL